MSKTQTYTSNCLRSMFKKKLLKQLKKKLASQVAGTVVKNPPVNAEDEEMWV